MPYAYTHMHAWICIYLHKHTHAHTHATPHPPPHTQSWLQVSRRPDSQVTCATSVWLPAKSEAAKVKHQLCVPLLHFYMQCFISQPSLRLPDATLQEVRFSQTRLLSPLAAMLNLCSLCHRWVEPDSKYLIRFPPLSFSVWNSLQQTIRPWEGLEGADPTAVTAMLNLQRLLERVKI